MNKTLVLLEVSQKQSYIFSSSKLQDNVTRSNEIAYVTGDLGPEPERKWGDFFAKAAGALYDRGENLVYAGGGHTVLQFDTPEQARAFAAAVTKQAMADFPGMEMFAKTLDAGACGPMDPGALLNELSRALERKKALRTASFRRMSLGVEALSSEAWKPVELERRTPDARFREDTNPWKDFETLAGDEGFLAVVHIDGNGMGARVREIYDKHRDPGAWDACCQSLRRFSEGIAVSFREALEETEAELAARGRTDPKQDCVPLRRLISAGDDICFVTRGSLGLEAAVIYLEKLAVKENPEQPGQKYAACAGVAMVHRKYPFHMAYDLSEELCSSAKRFGAEIDENGGVSAIDWHIEFGQLKDSLSELRRDYVTEDSAPERERRMELRPLAVVCPKELETRAAAVTGGVRTWAYFHKLYEDLRADDTVARSKLKGLRSAIRQGETETRYFLRAAGAEKPLLRLAARAAGLPALDSLFYPAGGAERCLVFDVIEMMDHTKLEKEGAE